MSHGPSMARDLQRQPASIVDGARPINNRWSLDAFRLLKGKSGSTPARHCCGDPLGGESRPGGSKGAGASCSHPTPHPTPLKGLWCATDANGCTQGTCWAPVFAWVGAGEAPGKQGARRRPHSACRNTGPFSYLLEGAHV